MINEMFRGLTDPSILWTPAETDSEGRAKTDSMHLFIYIFYGVILFAAFIGLIIYTVKWRRYKKSRHEKWEGKKKEEEEGGEDE